MAVELRKGQKISLEKKSSAGEIIVNLNWNRKTKGFLFKKSKPIDLDLSCLYELKNGKKGCVQAIGRKFGSLTDIPYISLDGDDRSGDSEKGETIRINGFKIPEIKRVLVYTMIYDGIVNWKEADGIVTVKCPSGEDFIVRLDDYSTNHTICAIALFENNGNDILSVEKIVRFFETSKNMDSAFNWGLVWTHGKK